MRDLPQETGVLARGECWSRIGVGGDATCPELEKHIHCRKCPVYKSAAASFLDREIPSEYTAERTEHFSRAKAAEEVQALSVTIFRVGADWLALPTTALDEVAPAHKAHALPHRRGGAVVGLVNIRGELLICVSLRRRLGLDGAEPMQRADGGAFGRLLVVKHLGRRLAFPVDEVYGIHKCRQDDLKAPPSTVARAATTHTKAVFSWENKSVGYLDEGKLFRVLNDGVA
ncbi:MAG TPA: chemotaxis protein CheW [Parvibaculum sp.]